MDTINSFSVLTNNRHFEIDIHLKYKLKIFQVMQTIILDLTEVSTNI